MKLGLKQILDKVAKGGLLLALFSVCLSSSALADYKSSLAAIRKCSRGAANNIEQMMVIMSALDKTDYRIKGGNTYASVTEEIFRNIKNMRNEITENGEKECKRSDLDALMEDVVAKANAGTQRWLNYATKKQEAGEDCLSGWDVGVGCTGSNTKDAIMNRKKELVEIKQMYEAAMADDVVMSQTGLDALNELKKCAPSEAEEIEEYIDDMKKLAHQTSKDFWDTKSGGTAQGRHKKITNILDDLRKEKKCNESALRAVAETTGQLAQEINKKWLENAKELGDDDAVENRTEDIAKIETQAKLRECPATSDVIAKYKAGCWSCLVLEKTTSAFLHAAKKALPVTQKAGLTLLSIGVAIWLVMWGLKNVSSFTEVQLGNILNDLIRFLFKVAIAYWFISYGPKAISQYFITPIMSVGAITGQQFWDSEIEKYVEVWDDIDFTEEDVASQDKETQEFVQEVSQHKIKITKPDTTELTKEEEQENEEAIKKNDANFSSTAIPNFLIPGVKSGNLSSPAGPRNCTNCSRCHKGVDIGQGCGSIYAPQSRCVDGCIPYIAAGKGTLTYKRPDGNGDGSGFAAIIDHGVINGHHWVTRYFHMRPYSSKIFNLDPSMTFSIDQGASIGCVGQSGGKDYPRKKLYPIHAHFEVQYDGVNVDPMMLPNGRIVKVDDICKCGTRNNEKSNCNAAGNGQYTIYRDGKAVGSGWPAAGKGIITLNSVENEEFSSYSGDSGSGDYSSLIVEIPEVKYTGPTDIMPKSVMNSILGATRAITDQTSETMVLGDVIMCYSTMKNGGAWHFDPKLWQKILSFGALSEFYVTDFIMYVEGFFVWCMGLVLTVAIAYYLIDISFKIGFAVLAIPLVMGLWPFEITKGKLMDTISIIAKASATFAFFIITTSFGMEMIKAAFDKGLDTVYDAIDTLSELEEGAVEGDDRLGKLRHFVSGQFSLFSTTFLLAGFSFIYFFKMVQATLSDIVDKFFPDNMFGDASPMHSGATMMTSFAKNMAMKLSGANLAKDIVSHQAGLAVKAGLKKGGGAMLHPVSTAKSIGNAAKSGFNKLRGK